MPTELPDSHKDLAAAAVASLTTTTADGQPMASLIWFVYDEDAKRFKFSLNTDRLKAKHIAKRPQVSLLIPDFTNPGRFVDVRGTATTEVDTDYAWASANVTPKYDADVRNFDAPGSTRLVVTIEPSNIYAVDISG